ncbi:FG-GAP-like repeat-containing protein [Ekhidna sp.]|jgi:hypothetical protein|uniref:FG-GAP-like repeat-containing protein n=1 Tax=Ekhidna sp. TaxID=2608089 RepID=UPI0032EE26B1
MNNFYQHSLNVAKEKYYKFKQRLEKKISTGQFDSLPRRKKNQLVSRVEKYKSRLEKLGFSMKGAAVAGSVTAMAAIPNIGHAQNPNIFLTQENDASIGCCSSPQKVELVNLDSDSDLEILFSGSYNHISNRVEEGDEISWENSYVPALSYMSGDFVVGDIDGDQDNDIIFNNGSIFYLALNDGEGNFQLSDDTYMPFSVTYYGSFGGESSASDIDLVDFDSDDDLDLVVAFGENNLSVFENDGDGNFIKGTLTVSGYQITDFEFADLDGDGDMDLLKSAYVPGGEGGYGRVYAVENTASENAEPVFDGFYSTVIDGQKYSSINDINVFDADADGDLDVFVSVDSFGYDYFYSSLNLDDEGDTGDFLPLSLSGYLFDEPGSVYDIGVADFDLDGDDEIIISTSGYDLQLLNFEDGNLIARSLSGGQIGDLSLTANDIAIGDIDGDGVADFAAFYGSSSVAFVYDRAAPYVDEFVGDVIIDENSPSGTLLGYLYFEDPQGDDITVSLEGEDASLFTFDEESGAITTNDTFDWEESGSEFNLEIVLSDGAKSNREEAKIKLRNLSEEGHGTFDEEGQPVFGTSTPVAFIAGDFDLDGDDDLFRSINTEGGGIPRDRASSLSSAFENAFFVQNDGFFDAIPVYGFYAKYNALFFDVDSDGDNELLTIDFEGDLDIFYFDDNLGYDDRNGYGYVGYVQTFEVGDFDGDGSDDIATLGYFEGGQYLTVFERYTGGSDPVQITFSQEVLGDISAGISILSYDFEISVGDFDGDGFDDVFVAKANYDDVIYFGGEFGLESAGTTAIETEDYGLSRPIAADFDGDGDIDVAILHNTDGNGAAITLFSNDGNASFTSAQVVEIGGESTGDVNGDLKVGDIDGDGTPDLITTFVSSYDMDENSYIYGAVTFVNDGNGSFEEKQAFDDVGGLDVELMDVDSDDDLDILISKTTYIEYDRCIECLIDFAGDSDSQDYIRVFFNTNAAPTGIELSITSFDEGAPIGESIGTLTVVDPNLNDSHTIFLTAGDGTNDADNSKFVVDGDQLVVIKDIEFDDDTEININVKAIDDYGKSVTASFTLTVNEVPLGLNDADDRLTLYPNPGGALMDITLNEQLSGDIEINVSDLNGRTIHREVQQVSGSFNTQIDMSSQKDGIYIVELKSGNQTFKQRWIKQD